MITIDPSSFMINFNLNQLQGLTLANDCGSALAKRKGSGRFFLAYQAHVGDDYYHRRAGVRGEEVKLEVSCRKSQELALARDQD